MKKFITVILAFVMLFILFTGCGNATETDGNTSSSASDSKTDTSIKDKSSLVLVVQNTRNSADPMLTYNSVVNAIYEATCSYDSKISIMEADGDPYMVDTVSTSLPTNIGKAKIKSIANDIAIQVAQIASQGAIPVTEGIDTLRALSMAARNLDADASEKVIIYLGSALPTTGTLDFTQKDYFNYDIDTVIESLKKLDAIPEFPEGTKIVFAGLGMVSKPQSNLEDSHLKTLTNLWKAICEAGGAEVDFITDTPTNTADKSEFPKVTTVDIMHVVAGGEEPELDDGGIILTEEIVSFKPDSYILSDKEATKALLKTMAQQIIDSGETVVIAGSTATVGENESCVAFSKKRAESIAEVFTELGVPSGQLKTVGLGYAHEWHTADTDKYGYLTDDAQQNRVVRIAPESSDLGQKLLKYE